jgi:RNA polymerase sigma factor (sigma-70 family)
MDDAVLGESEIRGFLSSDYPRMVAGLGLVLGGQAAAEDAIQEALARAWERSARGEHIESLRDWVAVVAMNLLRSRLRRLGAELRAQERVAIRERDAVENRLAASSVERLDLAQALASLPRRQREAHVFDRVRAKLKDVPAETVANWVINEPSPDIRAEVRAVADVVRLVNDGTISALSGKEVLAEARTSGRTAEEIIEERGLKQVSDASQLAAIVDEVLAENPGPAEQCRGGPVGIIGFRVGPVMKQTGNSANPKVAQDLLRERLSS